MKGNLKVTAASQEGSCTAPSRSDLGTDSPGIALFLLNLNVSKGELDLFVLLEYLKIFKFNSYFIVLCTGRSLENRDRDLQMKSFIYLFFTRNLEDFVDAVLKV